MPLPQLVMFLGGMGGSPVEDTFAQALAEDMLDTMERVLESGGVDGAFLATDNPQIGSRCSADVRVDGDGDGDGGPFHFGRRLTEIIRRHELERLLYLGAGSATLMKGDDFFSLGHYLGMAWNMVLTNNRYSADFAAFVPGKALLQVQPPAKDNLLPRVLHDEADLSLQELPRSTATQFNIDTPSDLAILKLVGQAGPRLTAWLDTAELDVSKYEACLDLLTDANAQVLVAGRVGSQVWQYLDKETACRVRLFSEERGMRAEGRELGKARSLLAYHLLEVGCERFFSEIAEVVDAAFIDTRVIFAHLARSLSRHDRFLSDIGRYQEIEDPFLREFTETAMKAPIPILLGGHSIVAGGLMALTERAWKDKPELTS
ncbi:MAG TPA: hypothetical protein VM013_04475 [Dehalococcoidia bacterium]|nr:hypothetical protein [Dehalococcoidia bacterium]